MDICDSKNQINDLLWGIFTEYNRMTAANIAHGTEKDLNLRNMSYTISSLEKSEKELHDKNRTLIKTANEYETMINDLQNKLEVATEEVHETNKFSMIGAMSKELTLKDREIDRLNGLLNHYKNKPKKIDTILDQVLEKSPDPVIVSENPEVEELDVTLEPQVNEDHVNEDQVTHVNEDQVNEVNEDQATQVNEDQATQVNEDQDHDLAQDPLTPVKIKETVETVEPDIGKLLIVTSKKVKYFVYEKEVPQKLYEFNDEKIPGVVVGKRTRNASGKFKVTLN